MFQALKRVVYQVSDLEAAKAWYARLLNLAPQFDTPFVVIFQINDCSLSLLKSGAPPAEHSDRLAVYWEVDDIDAACQTMRQMGATVHAELKNVLNIRVAQLKDPFGNIIGLSGKQGSGSGQTVEQKPSETAMNVAYCRALAAHDERESIKGPDHLAELFLSGEKRKTLLEAASRQIVISRFISSPLYGYFISRTAFCDALFRHALLDEDTAQIVLLGAGYDTRAYRLAAADEKTAVFEVDVPTTQEHKLAILKKAAIPCPSYLKHVAMNFKTDALQEVLLRSGFKPQLKTLFVWEGVSYYLEPHAVDQTLQVVSRFSGSGSVLAVDFMTQKMESINAGEPFLFWIEAARVASFLEERGFRLVDLVDAAEMEKRYLTLADGTPAEKSLTQFCLVHAFTK